MRPSETAGTATPDHPGSARRGGRLFLFLVVLAIVAYFLGRSIISQWATIRDYPWQFHAGWLVCSAVVIWVDFALLVHLWRVLLQAMSGKQLGFFTAFRISVIANFGKYIPGKVWSVLGMVVLLRQEGYSAPSALAATMLHQAYTVVSGLIYVAVVMGSEIFGGKPMVPLVIGVAAGLLILYPPVFSALLNFGLRLLKREQLTVTISFAMAAGLFVAYILAWIIYGTGFWCMLLGFGIHPESFWRTGAVFSAAYLLGFLALFAPGGLGVREGTLSLLLGTTMAPGLAALIAVASRLWMTVIEIVQSIPALLTNRKKIGTNNTDS